MLVDKFGIYLQHIQNMSEDTSFKPADRQKFRGWLRKWQHGRVPLLSCLFVEILSPAKGLSLAFQGEDVDIVKACSCIENANSQLDRLKRKDVYELPTVKRFLSKVESSGGQSQYQNVTQHKFKSAKESLTNVKNNILEKITEALETRLEIAESPIVNHATAILNTQGWERETESLDDSLTVLYDHFKVPLTNGLNSSLHDLLEEWHSLVQYTNRYLNPSQVPYLCVWRRIFDSGNTAQWSNILILVELLFTLPISNAKVERLFSLMKRIKTDSRSSLNEQTLNNLVRICAEGPDIQDFDPAPAMKQWALSAVRRPHQRKRKKYTTKEQGKKARVLIETEETDEEDLV